MHARGDSIYDFNKMFGNFDTPPSPLSKLYVLFVRKFGAFLTPPPSVRTSYEALCVDVMYGSPLIRVGGSEVMLVHEVHLSVCVKMLAFPFYSYLNNATMQR